MRLALLHVLAIACSAALSAAGPQDSSQRRRKRNWNVYSNGTSLDETGEGFLLEGPAGLAKRDGTKYVFMHHVRYNFQSSFVFLIQFDVY